MNEDLISRQAALEALEFVPWVEKPAFDAIKALPSAEPQRKTGRWIWDDEGYHCSECFYHPSGMTLECWDGTYKFCPVCGAEMKGESDD